VGAAGICVFDSVHALEAGLKIHRRRTAQRRLFAAGLSAGIRCAWPLDLRSPRLAVTESGQNTLDHRSPLVNTMVQELSSGRSARDGLFAIGGKAERKWKAYRRSGAAGLPHYWAGNGRTLARAKKWCCGPAAKIDPLAHSRVIERGLAMMGVL